MADEKRVRDIMGFSSVIEVEQDRSIKETVAVSLPALKSGYNPTILVKDRGRITGMLSCEDLLNALLPSYTKGDIKMEIFWEGLFQDQWRNIADSTIKDLMRPPVWVDINDPLSKVAYKLVTGRIGTALVIDDGKVVGTISTGDLFSHLLEGSALEYSA